MGKREAKNHLGDLDVDGTILKWVFKRLKVRMWSGFIWPRIGFSGGII
jgi:hypothetical protein